MNSNATTLARARVWVGGLGAVVFNDVSRVLSVVPSKTEKESPNPRRVKFPSMGLVGGLLPGLPGPRPWQAKRPIVRPAAIRENGAVFYPGGGAGSLMLPVREAPGLGLLHVGWENWRWKTIASEEPLGHIRFNAAA